MFIVQQLLRSSRLLLYIYRRNDSCESYEGDRQYQARETSEEVETRVTTTRCNSLARYASIMFGEHIEHIMNASRSCHGPVNMITNCFLSRHLSRPVHEKQALLGPVRKLFRHRQSIVMLQDESVPLVEQPSLQR